MSAGCLSLNTPVTAQEDYSILMKNFAELVIFFPKSTGFLKKKTFFLPTK
jgi:hypothetical protein